MNLITRTKNSQNSQYTHLRAAAEFCLFSSSNIIISSFSFSSFPSPFSSDLSTAISACTLVSGNPDLKSLLWKNQTGCKIGKIHGKWLLRQTIFYLKILETFNGLHLHFSLSHILEYLLYRDRGLLLCSKVFWQSSRGSDFKQVV